MMDVELDSLDLEVKRMMLGFPNIFPTRMHCLEHLFCCNGNGYDWHWNGTLSSSVDNRYEPMPTHIEKAEPRDFGALATDMDEHETIRLDYENMIRNFREKHIDHLCTAHANVESDMSCMSVYPMSWDYCAMGKAAEKPDKIADEWREGIHEFIQWYQAKVYGYYGCNSDSKEFITDERTKMNYRICSKVKEMLLTDADRINGKLTMKRMRKVMHKARMMRNLTRRNK